MSWKYSELSEKCNNSEYFAIKMPVWVRWSECAGPLPDGITWLVSKQKQAKSVYTPHYAINGGYSLNLKFCFSYYSSADN